jgi:DNA gyrase subunit A
MLNGSITDEAELMEVLGAPSFTTGGYIHGSATEYVHLAKTGKGSITVSGTVETYSDKIVITEITYKTTIEAILDEIREYVKSGELKEIIDVRDATDLNGLKAIIELKRGCNVGAVLRKINRLTKLRMQISFITRVVVSRNKKQACESFGLMELLQEWITFRLATLQRIYTYRLTKRSEQEHLLCAWEKIKDDIQDVVRFIATNEEARVKAYLMNNFGMDEIQADYIMDMRVREITKDRLAKKLAELAAARKDIELYKTILEGSDKKVEIIISELKTIGDKYGANRTTVMTDPLPTDTGSEDKEEQIEDTTVSVIVTKKGYVKRLITWRDESNLTLHDDDEIRQRFSCSNKDTVLVFTYSGMCYKIPVHTIDASRGVPKDYIFNLVDKADDSEILHVAPSNDYKDSINIVYDSGRGTKVSFDEVAGNRSRYKSLFEAGKPGTLWCTDEDKFFIITHRRRAAYIDLDIVSKLHTRSAFKVARIQGDDAIYGIQPLNKVPDSGSIDLEKYQKGYCVNIKDKLWE